MAKVYDWDAMATDLFDALADRAEGMDRHEIIKALDLTREKHVYKVIRQLRLALGAGDTINVSIRRDRNRSVYFLTGVVEDVSPWSRTRMREQLSKLEGLSAVWHSLAAGTDGRTIAGKVARHVSLYLDRLLEDVRIELAGA